MKNETVSFRPSDKCRRKILELMEDGRSRTNVIEEAIDYYYAMKKNQMTDDPIYHLMKTAINESIGQWSQNIRDHLSKQEEDNRYIFAYLDMCLKGFGFDDDEKAAVELMRSNSHFKQILDRTVAVEIARQQKNDGQ